MLADLRILDAGEEILLDTERVALQELFNMIRRFSVGYDVELHKRTLERGLLSLLGPDAAAVAGAESLDAGRACAHDRRRVGAIAARAIRTDLGIDLLCDAEDTEALADALVRAGAGPRPRRSRTVRSSTAGLATASTSTTPSSPRRPASTLARSRSPRAATSARRRSPACTTGASPTGSCAACGCRLRSRAAPRSPSGTASSAGWQRRRVAGARPDRAGAGPPRGAARLRGRGRRRPGRRRRRRAPLRSAA